MSTNLWQPGQSGNPAGRLRGSRNKFSEEVICAFLRDFREHGQKAIAKVRRTQPAAYLKICSYLVPKEMKLEHTSGVKEMTDEELEEAIALVREVLEQRAKGLDAKLVGLEVVEPDAIPAPRQPQRKPRDKLMAPITSGDTST
jgi:hypothetical protein